MGNGQRCGRSDLSRILRIAPLADVNLRRSVTALSKRIHVDFDAPPELIEAIAERVVELLAPRLDAPGEWLTAAEAAEYLRCPLSRIYALSSVRRIPLYHDGSRLLFKRSELDRWVSSGGSKRC